MLRLLRYNHRREIGGNMSKQDLVKNYILKNLDNETYVPGEMIESTTTLREVLGVSLMTVRGAIQELVDEGLLYTEKGKGIFVSHPPKFLGFRCGTNFSKEIEKLGMNVSTRNASLKIIEADDHLANVFSIKEGTKLWMVKRVRYANQSPVMDAVEYFIYDDIPELSLEIINNSIYDFLESKGIIFNHADQKIEACSASESIANRLYIKQSEALVKVTLISMIKKGTVFSYSIEYFRTDTFTLNQTIYA